MKHLILGCGYFGQRLAKAWLEDGHEVHAITRSHSKAIALQTEGLRPHVVNWYDPESWPSIDSQWDVILVSVSHAPVAGIEPSQTHSLGLDNFFRSVRPQFRKLIYLSTTGVFEACDDGRWLSEESPVAPNRPGSIAALAAERWLEKKIPRDQLVVLRAAGIYGPERVPRLDDLRQGQPLSNDPDSFLNLIHVDDLVQIAIRFSVPKSPSGLFCVADGRPVLRRDYYRFIADYLGFPSPTFSDSNLSQKVTAPRRGEGSKRIDTARLRQVLAYDFLFPNYQAGLRPLLNEQD
jgi:nucleoside-diphosphate-sugar epimerase